jgi:hypothetical protein
MDLPQPAAANPTNPVIFFFPHAALASIRKRISGLLRRKLRLEA